MYAEYDIIELSIITWSMQ